MLAVQAVQEPDLVPPESRSPIAIGIEWAARIMAVGVGFALPILVGVGADHVLRSRPIGLAVGMVLGLGLGLLMFVRLVQDLQRSTSDHGAR